MKGRRQIAVSLNIMDDLIKGNLNRAHTDDVPADAVVIAVIRAPDDILKGSMTLLVESEEWPELMMGSIPPTLNPVYTREVEPA